MQTDDTGRFPMAPLERINDEIEQSLSEQADLIETQRLYSAVTSPEFDAFLDWVREQRETAAKSLMDAVSMDRVTKLQARVAFADEILGLADDSVIKIQAMQEGLDDA